MFDKVKGAEAAAYSAPPLAGVLIQASIDKGRWEFLVAGVSLTVISMAYRYALIKLSKESE